MKPLLDIFSDLFNGLMGLAMQSPQITFYRLSAIIRSNSLKFVKLIMD